MELKWIGAVLIVGGCGWGGFSMAGYYRSTERYLAELARGLEYMISELRFRAPPLPDLLKNTAAVLRGPVAAVLDKFSQVLTGSSPCQAGEGMIQVLQEFPLCPGEVYNLMNQLGNSLGVFDLDGQLRELESLKEDCQRILSRFRQGRDERLRSYQTLGLCAGAALALILI